MDAYEEAISHCSTEHAPRFIIPANHKWFRNLAVARIMVEHMEGLKMDCRNATVDIEEIRGERHAAK